MKRIMMLAMISVLMFVSINGCFFVRDRDGGGYDRDGGHNSGGSHDSGGGHEQRH